MIISYHTQQAHLTEDVHHLQLLQSLRFFHADLWALGESLLIDDDFKIKLLKRQVSTYVLIRKYTLTVLKSNKIMVWSPEGGRRERWRKENSFSPIYFHSVVISTWYASIHLKLLENEYVTFAILKKQMNIKLFSPSLWALSPQFIYSFTQTFRHLMDLRLVIHGSLEVCVPAGQES